MSNNARKIIAALVNLAIYATGFVALWHLVPFVRRGDIRVTTGGWAMLAIAWIAFIWFVSQPIKDFLEDCGFTSATFIGRIVSGLVGSSLMMAIFALFALVFPRIVAVTHPFSWIVFTWGLTTLWGIGDYVEARIKRDPAASK